MPRKKRRARRVVWNDKLDMELLRLVGVGRSWNYISTTLKVSWSACKERHEKLLVKIDESANTKPRNCLTCGKEFMSWGAGNRLCEEHRRFAAGGLVGRYM